jgi:hypothetical protein
LQQEWREAGSAVARVNDLLSARHRLSGWATLPIPVRLREARDFVAALQEARREAERCSALAALAREVQERETQWLGVVQTAGGLSGRSLSLGEVTLGRERGQVVCVPYRWGGEASAREDLVLRGPLAFWMSTEDLTPAGEGGLPFAAAQERVRAFATPEVLAQARVRLAVPMQRYADLVGRPLRGLEVRLPTAEEWELAARGMDGRAYPWGNDRPGEREEQRILRGEDQGRDRSPFGFRWLAGRYAEWVVAEREGREARVAGAGYWDLRLVRSAQTRTFDRDPPGKMGYRIVVAPVLEGP